MNAPQIDAAFADLRRQSFMSLVLMLLGVVFVIGSIYYAATRLRPLEAQIASKQATVQALTTEEDAQRERIAQLQREYATLKANTEQLYAVRVTPQNQVYELKASAQATGGKIAGGRTEYRFEVYVNSPSQTLASIKAVTYVFDHPSFPQKEFVASNGEDRFMASYYGWGCLRRVGVSVALDDGTTQSFDFDFCRSLGPQWGKSGAASDKGVPEKGAFPSKERFSPAQTTIPRSPSEQRALPDRDGKLPSNKLPPPEQKALPDEYGNVPKTKLPPPEQRDDGKEAPR